MIDLTLSHEPGSKLGSWRLNLDASYASDDPREVLERATRELGSTLEGLARTLLVTPGETRTVLASAVLGAPGKNGGL